MPESKVSLADLQATVNKIPKYLVTLAIGKRKVAQLEVPSFLGPDAAGRRAVMTAAAMRWADLPDIKVMSSLLFVEA